MTDSPNDPSYSTKRSGDAPLRIALVSVHGGPLIPLGAEEAGGQNVYVREVALALAEQGHHVDVYTRGRHCEAPEILPLGKARVIRLPAGPTGFIPRGKLANHLPAFLAAMQRFAADSGLRYDLIHSNYWLSGQIGLVLARRWQIPQTHTCHSLGAVKYAVSGTLPPEGRLRLGIEQQVLTDCAAVIATSVAELADMGRHYRSRQPVAVVPCGVDTARFHPMDQLSSRAALWLPSDGLIMAYVGRFDPRKGIATFIQAAAAVARHQPVRIILAGGFDPDAEDAVEFARIQLMVRDLGLADQTTFLGSVEHDRLPMVYAAADICVVPSLYEPFGMVAIEAMACGTPVIASRVGGLAQSVVEGETGVLVPPGDSEALARACRGLLADAGARRRMGTAGLARVRARYTWPTVAEELTAVYRDMIDDRGRASGNRR